MSNGKSLGHGELGRVDRFPALAVRIRTWIPGFRVLQLDAGLPVLQMCRQAKESAKENMGWVYLVLSPQRSILFRADGTWEVTTPPRGYMFFYKRG
jgi:hypothetical protein